MASWQNNFDRISRVSTQRKRLTECTRPKAQTAKDNIMRKHLFVLLARIIENPTCCVFKKKFKKNIGWVGLMLEIYLILYTSTRV